VSVFGGGEVIRWGDTADYWYKYLLGGAVDMLGSRRDVYSTSVVTLSLDGVVVVVVGVGVRAFAC
jgi:hypothetical protein